MHHSNVRLTWEAITLQLRHPFRLSYGVSETRQSFWLRLAGDEGWGEPSSPARLNDRLGLTQRERSSPSRCGFRS